MDNKRSSDFQRNEKLEELLKEINSRLKPVQDQVNIEQKASKFPLIFIVGCPRAGTTLFMQWLAHTNEFSYPSNLISRFYAAPYIGALVQMMLFDREFRYRNEFSDLDHEISYLSSLGKTRGILDPNEFWYFWRRYFPEKDVQFYKDFELKKVNIKGFIAELASIESVFSKPFATKGIYLNWNIPYLCEMIPKPFFIYIKRNPYYTAQSLIESREKFFGDINTWYSFKPREYESLKRLDPYSQVAGQVFFTNRTVDRSLQKISETNKFIFEYERFCENPETIYSGLREKLNSLGCTVSDKYSGPESFNATNSRRLSEDLFDRIKTAYDEHSQE